MQKAFQPQTTINSNDRDATVQISTAKHTPGPWYYDAEEFCVTAKDEEFHWYWTVADIGTPFMENEGECNEAIAHANGKLISAAPELLAALKSALPMLKGHQETPERVARYEAAAAAISKAERK